MTLFEQCVEAVGDAAGSDATFSPRGVVLSVLATVQANTESPRTVDEMARILAEVE